VTSPETQFAPVRHKPCGLKSWGVSALGRLPAVADYFMIGDKKLL
jgi:hypothetical protein